MDEMVSVEEALAISLAGALPLDSEWISPGEASGRFAAQDITAITDSPPFDNSAVDGYAVRLADVADASADSPRLIRVTDTVNAGPGATGALEAGTAVRIMTGAPVPAGTEAVVMVEDTVSDRRDEVQVLASPNRGQHVRLRGQDFKAGEPLLNRGGRITPAAVGLLASAGVALVPAIRRPRVAILTTGDEVVEVSGATVLPAGAVYNSNGPMLEALVETSGAIVSRRVHIPDDPEETERLIALCARDADVVISAGGVSMGERDYVRAAVQKLGRLDQWRVRVKPGKPLVIGAVGGARFFGLPGNPVSALVTFELFARPLLRIMAGESHGSEPRIMARLVEPVHHEPGRREYLRGQMWSEQGAILCRPVGGQGSNQLRAAATANALLEISEDHESVPAGTVIRILMLCS